MDRKRVRTIVIVNWERYNPPHAAVSSAKRKDFDLEPLKWVRLQCDWYRDIDIVSMPASSRLVWPALLAICGESVPHGRASLSVHKLSKKVTLDEDEVAAALTHLWKAGLIRYSVGGKNHPAAGYVPTYLRTHEQTNEGSDFSKEEPTKDGTWIRDPELRRLYDERQARKRA